MLDAPLTVRELHRSGAEGLLRRPHASIASCPTSSSRPAIRAATVKAARATRSATRSISGRTCAARSGWRSTGRHGRQPVLHHPLAAAAPRRALHRLRARALGHGRRRSDSAVGRDPAGAGLGCGTTRADGRKLKRGRRPPPFFDGRGRLTASCRPSSSRPWLSSPLSVIPPFSGFTARALTTSISGCRLARAPESAPVASGHLPLYVSAAREPGHVSARLTAAKGRGRTAFNLTRGGLSWPPSYQM